MKSFGKYQILEKVGEGGFGTLYRGFDPLIQRTVAVKTCTSDDSEVRDRFFREAKIAGNLHHRNITIVHDFGIEAGVPYLVQEYLSGEDLHRKIERSEQLPFGTKLLYLIQIVRGLEHAHNQGVVHRDIKPSNIRVLPDGTVKIMDFGIAKVQSLHNSMTQTGETIGTAAYLSPEQIQGEEVDARADIFSFGVLAYELLTGEPAFSGETPSTVLYAVLSRKPRPIREHWAACPPEVQAVVDRCLEKDRDQRYADCAELLADLNSLLDGKDLELVQKPRSGVIAPPSGRIRSAMARQELSSADTVAIGRPSVSSARQRRDSESEDLAGDSERSSETGSDVFALPIEDKLGARTASPSNPSQRSAIGLLMLLLVISGLGTGIWWYGKGFRAIWAKAPDRTIDQSQGQAAPERPDPGATDLARLDFEPSDEPLRLDAEAKAAADGEDSAETKVVPAELAEAEARGIGAGTDPIGSAPTATPGPPPEQKPAAGSAVPSTGSVTTATGESPTTRSSLAESLLTVRQVPGTERCFIRLDGQDTGWTPREKLALPPGSYQLDVYLSEQATVPILSQSLILNRGMASIVTVDLDQGVVHIHERALSDEVPPSDRP